MAKETLYINYKGTGIKTTRGLADILFVVGIIGTIGFFIASISTEEPIFMIFSLSFLLTGFLFWSVLRAVATIADNSLLQRTKLFNELSELYYIEEKK